MQQGAGSDIRVPLCGYKQSRPGAGCASVVRSREGTEGSFFFDDEDPVTGREGEVRYIFGIWYEDALGSDQYCRFGGVKKGGEPRSRKSNR